MSSAVIPLSEFAITADELRIATILTHASGTLSVLGSASILWDIYRWRQGRNRNPVRQRLLAGMSLCDLASSIAYALGSVPVPPNPGSPWLKLKKNMWAKDRVLNSQISWCAGPGSFHGSRAGRYKPLRSYIHGYKWFH